ncbi:unnamed protein product [Prunus armeniaca]
MATGPPRAIWTSSTQKAARARHRIHQPRQAHGQFLTGLNPKGANVSVTSRLTPELTCPNGKMPRGACRTP